RRYHAMDAPHRLVYGGNNLVRAKLLGLVRIQQVVRSIPQRKNDLDARPASTKAADEGAGRGSGIAAEIAQTDDLHAVKVELLDIALWDGAPPPLHGPEPFQLQRVHHQLAGDGIDLPLAADAGYAGPFVFIDLWRVPLAKIVEQRVHAIGQPQPVCSAGVV